MLVARLDEEVIKPNLCNVFLVIRYIAYKQ